MSDYKYKYKKYKTKYLKLIKIIGGSNKTVFIGNLSPKDKELITDLFTSRGFKVIKQWRGYNKDQHMIYNATPRNTIANNAVDIVNV